MMEEDRARAAYDRSLQRGFEGAAQQTRQSPPPHTVQGRLMALEEALHRLINITDDLERLTAPFRNPPAPPIRGEGKVAAVPAMSEVAEQVDRAAENVNAITDRLMGMADGFK